MNIRALVYYTESIIIRDICYPLFSHPIFRENAAIFIVIAFTVTSGTLWLRFM